MFENDSDVTIYVVDTSELVPNLYELEGHVDQRGLFRANFSAMDGRTVKAKLLKGQARTLRPWLNMNFENGAPMHLQHTDLSDAHHWYMECLNRQRETLFNAIELIDSVYDEPPVGMAKESK